MDQLKRFLIYYGAISLASNLLMLRIFDQLQNVNFWASQVFVFLALVFFSLAITLLFFKKSIALFMSVIVLKWPVLGYMVFLFQESWDVEPEAFAAGIAPLTLSALIFAILIHNE